MKMTVAVWGLTLMTVVFGTMVVDAMAERLVIGAVEEIIILPWKLKLSARIDTGAATSSLDVCNLKTVGRREVEFNLPERCGGMKMRLPVVAWRTIKSTEGASERRPVVELEICLGPKQLRTQITLNDRSQLEYPVLIGRNTLDGNFIVDVSRSNVVSPHCQEVSP